MVGCHCRLQFLVLGLVSPGVVCAAAGDTWHLAAPHSSAQFAVRHLGISTIRGAFTKVSGDVNYVPSDHSKSSVEVTIDASSVDTRVTMRDNDLRSERFLDVAKYPAITFKSKRVSSPGPGRLTILGDLTIYGVTQGSHPGCHWPQRSPQQSCGSGPAHGRFRHYQD
jgi:polyisoprenoid-binding protein YceI